MNAVLLLAGISAIAVVLTLIAQRLARKRHFSLIVAIVLASVCILALAGGATVSRITWGYWFNPPPIDSRVLSGARITGFGAFETERDEGGRFTQRLIASHLLAPQNADPTECPLELTLYQLRAAGLSVREKGVLDFPLQRIRSLPLDLAVRVKSSKGYDSHERLSGFWMEFKGNDGREYLFVAADGGQVWDDHYPHYRLLYQRLPSGSLALVSHQVFYFDVAGIEGMRWYVFSLILGLLGLTLAIPFIYMFLWVRSRRSRTAARP